jgi:hypothetical protein
LISLTGREANSRLVSAARPIQSSRLVGTSSSMISVNRWPLACHVSHPLVASFRIDSPWSPSVVKLDATVRGPVGSRCRATRRVGKLSWAWYSAAYSSVMSRNRPCDLGVLPMHIQMAGVVVCMAACHATCTTCSVALPSGTSRSAEPVFLFVKIAQ